MTRTALLLWMIFAGPAQAINAAEMFDDPEKEARAREIGRELRCVVCRNQSIFDSNAGVAHDLRRTVRERIVAGDTDDEVLAFVQERFGDYVLLNPPVNAHTYVLWAAPFVCLGLGLAGAAVYLRGRARDLPSGDEEVL